MPELLFTLLIVTFLGGGMGQAMLAVAIAFTPGMARIARSSVLSIRTPRIRARRGRTRRAVPLHRAARGAAKCGRTDRCRKHHPRRFRHHDRRHAGLSWPRRTARLRRNGASWSRKHGISCSVMPGPWRFPAWRLRWLRWGSTCLAMRCATASIQGGATSMAGAPNSSRRCAQARSGNIGILVELCHAIRSTPRPEKHRSERGTRPDPRAGRRIWLGQIVSGLGNSAVPSGQRHRERRWTSAFWGKSARPDFAANSRDQRAPGSVWSFRIHPPRSIRRCAWAINYRKCSSAIAA